MSLLTRSKTANNRTDEISCFYTDFREPPGSIREYQPTRVYWEVMAVRIALFCVFDHLIYFITEVLAQVIPDVPDRVQDRFRRAEFLLHQLILRSEHERARISGIAAHLPLILKTSGSKKQSDSSTNAADLKPPASTQQKMSSLAKQAAQKRSLIRDGREGDPSSPRDTTQGIELKPLLEQPAGNAPVGPIEPEQIGFRTAPPAGFAIDSNV